mgnify:CR=1 FL=1
MNNKGSSPNFFAPIAKKLKIGNLILFNYDTGEQISGYVTLVGEYGCWVFMFEWDKEFYLDYATLDTTWQIVED